MILADHAMIERRQTFMMIVILGFLVSIPVASLFAIIGIYAYQFGASFKARGPLYVTLPLVVAAGLVHFFVPIIAADAYGSFWAFSVSSFAIWTVVVLTMQRMPVFTPVS